MLYERQIPKGGATHRANPRGAGLHIGQTPAVRDRNIGLLPSPRVFKKTYWATPRGAGGCPIQSPALREVALYKAPHCGELPDLDPLHPRGVALLPREIAWNFSSSKNVENFHNFLIYIQK